jgi:hypothetical protein
LLLLALLWRALPLLLRLRLCARRECGPHIWCSGCLCALRLIGRALRLMGRARRLIGRALRLCGGR